MVLWKRLQSWIEIDGLAGMITVTGTRGSTPRERGACMIMRRDGQHSGTIGGGALEWMALQDLQALLRDAKGSSARNIRQSLGPALGQCCGGTMDLRIEVLSRADLDWIARHISGEASLYPSSEDLAAINILSRDYITRTEDDRHPLLLFGAGHVGQALALALAPLPFTIQWIDQRPDAFPAAMPGAITYHGVEYPETMIAKAPTDAFIVVMTHSHAVDFAIVDAALRRPDMLFVGLIGSLTKRARFISRLKAAGHDEATIARLACPIGLPDLPGKIPAVIAASVAAQLLQQRAKLLSQHSGTEVPPDKTLQLDDHTTIYD